MRRALIIVFCLAVVLGAVSATGATEITQCTYVTPTTTGTGANVAVLVCTADPGAPPSPPSPPGDDPPPAGPPSTVECTDYESDGLGDPVNPIGADQTKPGDRVFRWCIDRATGETVFSEYVTIGAGGQAPPIDAAVLAQYAQAKLVLPVPAPRTWPGVDRPQITGVATWLHVDNFTADSRSATAGAVTATVFAEPAFVQWEMGDGGRVRCDDAGAVWRVDASSNCQYLFVNRSTGQGDGRFHGSVTITWRLRWESNVGQGGDLGEVSRTAAIDWNVQELQAVIN